MLDWTKRAFCLAIFAALAACQPALDSQLPQGQAAYDVVRVDDATFVEALNRLQPNDEIGISVFQEEDLSIDRILIDTEGKIVLQLIGEVQASGLTPARLADRIESAYGERYLRDPDVAVQLVQRSPRVVAVEGDVRTPGVYPIERGYTLLSAMALAGSPTATASLDEVLVFREIDGVRYGGRFDLTDIRAGRAEDPTLVPGDTIVVGYSRARILYQDFIRTAPIIGAFTRF